MRKTFLISSIVVAGIVVRARSAEAQTFNDNCTNNSNECLSVVNSGSQFGIYAQSTGGEPAIFATNQTTNAGGYGVEASTIGGAAFSGLSAGSNGVQGISNEGVASGVYGQNNSQGYGVAGRSTGSGTAIYGDNTSSTGWSGYFTGRVYLAVGYTSSDIRLKKNVAPLASSLDTLLKLQGVSFEWKDPDKRGAGQQLGFIAQDLEKVFPQWVTTDPTGFKAVDTKGIDALLVESVRTLKVQNDELRVRDAGLEDRIKALEAKQQTRVSSMGASQVAFGSVLLFGAAFMFGRRKRNDKPND